MANDPIKKPQKKYPIMPTLSKRLYELYLKRKQQPFVGPHMPSQPSAKIADDDEE